MSDGIQTLGLNPRDFTYYKNWERQGYPMADFMIVDEAQDFTREEIQRLVGAQKTCFLFGDTAQSLYKSLGRTMTIPEIIGLTRFEPKTLEFNYRLPKKIARLASHIGDDESMTDLESRCKEEGTELPHVDRFGDTNAQLDAICKTIDARHFEDVGILFLTNPEVEYAYNYLRNKGRTVEAKYEDRRDWHNSKMDLDFSANNTNPKLMTCNSAKGVQFEAVFMPNCHTRRQDDRNKLYVAVTRSYQSLYIMHTGPLSVFFDPVPNTVYQSGTATVADDRVTI
jgi:superfamily I DNA/RNA helicase